MSDKTGIEWHQRTAAAEPVCCKCPILFSAPMVRALLEGRKSQTRRVAQTFGEGMHYGRKLCEWDLSSGPFQITAEDLPVWRWRGNKSPQVGDWAQLIQTDVDDYVTFPIRQPYGVPGDRLWVRETWSYAELGGYDMRADGGQFWYRATDVGQVDGPWKPSIHMPRAASRITLEITDVRVQRVQEISEEDALAEGPGGGGEYIGCYDQTSSYWTLPAPIANFGRLWDSINGKKHPWVWALTFRRLESA